MHVLVMLDIETALLLCDIPQFSGLLGWLTGAQLQEIRS